MTENYKEWLDLDVDSIEPLNVSDSRKTDIKRQVLIKSHKKKSYIQMSRLTVAAIIVISAVTTMSFTYPTVASQIPFMQNIISYFNNEDTIYENYGDFATEIGHTQVSNDASVMIENAVYDGTSVTVSYAIETEVDLGSHPNSSGRFDIEDSNAMGGSGSIRKISDTTYVGIETIKPYFDNTAPDQIEVNWQPKTFINQDTNTEISGDWEFNFTLTKLDNEIQAVNQSVRDHGVAVLVSSLEKNEMSTVIEFESVVEDEAILKKWPYVSVQFETIEDNLGNTYVDRGNGGRSDDNGVSYKLSTTIDTIEPNATSLKLVPIIYFSLGSGKGLETKEMEPITIELQ